eukprot:5546209-Amphidinium_carterae.1
MLQQLSPARLDSYRDHIKRYVDRYSSAAWPLIYQAEVRARLELSERLRRKCQLEYDQAMASGAGHPYDPTMPWELVFQR